MHGEWSPEADSAIILVWDNTYSFLREKVIAFQAHVTKAPQNADEVETIEGTTQTSRGNSPAVTPPPMLNAAGDKASPILPLEEPESVVPATAAVIAELVKADENEEDDRSDAPPNSVEEMGDGNDGDGAANSALEGSKKKNKKKKNKKKKEESAP